MIDKHLYNKKSPKYYVRKYFEQNKHLIANKTIVDFPCGNGVLSEYLRQLGANVIPLEQIHENVYMQYFLGFSNYTYDDVFDRSLFT